MEYIIIAGIIIILVFIHVFYRQRETRAILDLTQLTLHVTNRALLNKGVITEGDIKKAQKFVNKNMDLNDYKEMKKNIEDLGINIDD